ncbi:hypothetical protein KC325_g309 [Hortaea werneckii]|nr:hypothetical protein KC325_g309 [Hortaea werneckii]
MQVFSDYGQRRVLPGSKGLVALTLLLSTHERLQLDDLLHVLVEPGDRRRHLRAPLDPQASRQHSIEEASRVRRPVVERHCPPPFPSQLECRTHLDANVPPFQHGPSKTLKFYRFWCGLAERLAPAMQ